MRKDIKTGMLGGTILCMAGIAWFCSREQIIHQPIIKIEQQNQTSEAVHIYDSAAKPKVSIPAKSKEKSTTVEIDRVHIVAQGETLSDISKIYYNNTGKWKKIYEANKGLFPKGPDRIKPGMRLIIPQ